MPKRNSGALIFFITITCVLFLLIYQFRWTGHTGANWREIIKGDARGYYAYLEQVFEKQNFGYAPVDHNHVMGVNGRSVIKYFCGTALLSLPFYAGAHAVNAIFRLPEETATEIMLKSFSISGLFYLLLGIIFLFMIFKRLEIKPLYALMAVFFVLFATNLLNYAVLEPMMSHVYSFCMISGFLYFSLRFIQEGKWKFIIASSIFLGLIWLVRPLNVVIAGFVPFFFSGMRDFFRFVKSQSGKIITGIFVFVCIAGIQNVLWFLQCGKWVVWSYQHEGFYFLHPQVFNVLFSFRKGLFIYTPVLLLFICGLYFLFRRHKFQSFIWVLFFASLVYLISSWWCWSYFDGFGMRPFVDFYAVLAIPFAFLLNDISRLKRLVILGLGLFCLVLNLVQTYQYHTGIIHPEYMNRKSYAYVFMRTAPKYRNIIGGVYDLMPYNKYKAKLLIEINLDLSAGYREKKSGIVLFPDGVPVMLFDGKTEFNQVLQLENNPEIFAANRLFAELCFEKWDYESGSASEALLVCDISTAHKNLFYYACRLDYLPSPVPKQWQKICFSLIIPKISEPAYTLKFYFWNRALQHFAIRDFKVRIYRTA